MYIFIIAAAFIAVVTFVASRLARNEVIRIPREPGPGTGNELGRKISQNICPKCGDTEGFFKGMKTGLVYCGNSVCRTGFYVLNYGPGEVMAKEIEQGPSHFYHGQAGAWFHEAITPVTNGGVKAP